ncbi:hypothetical protein LCGC14_0716440, partial [marine sediment metagenome]
VKENCLECLETFDCPDCTRVTDAPRGKILRGRGGKRKAVDCERCEGLGQVTEGTGGSVYIDGERITYKSYVGKLRHGMITDDTKIRMPMQCDNCSATGSTPRAKICGLFVPQNSEYILRPEDEAKALDKLREAGIVIVPPGTVLKETVRKCGTRMPGGYYVVTDPEAGADQSKVVIDTLVKNGLVEPEGIDVNGAFASFVTPITVTQKRFRGIKKISVPTGAARSTQDILDAMA